MPFVNVWDNTFPPDTQQANLLGQDIRNTKSDIQQRMIAFAMGILADRPTPDPATAGQGWGSTNDGVSYFAWDTGQIFMWNGAAWVEKTSNFVFRGLILKSVAPVSHTGTVTKDAVVTLTLPANSCTPTQQFRVTLQYEVITQIGSSDFLSFDFGGQNVSLGLTAVQGQLTEFQWLGGNNGATNAQTWQAKKLTNGGVNPLLFNGSPTTVDTTALVNFVFSVQNATAADQQTIFRVLIELL